MRIFKELVFTVHNSAGLLKYHFDFRRSGYCNEGYVGGGCVMKRGNDLGHMVGGWGGAYDRWRGI